MSFRVHDGDSSESLRRADTLLLSFNLDDLFPCCKVTVISLTFRQEVKHFLPMFFELAYIFQTRGENLTFRQEEKIFLLNLFEITYLFLFISFQTYTTLLGDDGNVPKIWAKTFTMPMKVNSDNEIMGLQDDGNLLKNLANADIVLLGISRVQKTPLSMYLAQQFGLKVSSARQVCSVIW